MIVWALLSFLSTLFLLPVVRKVALEHNFIDYPDERKRHNEAVPPVGGLVVIPVFVIFSLIAGLNVQEHGYFLAALALVWVLGALDDKYGLSANLKFMVQLFAAFLLVAGNQTAIHYLGDLFGFGEIWTKPVTMVFSVLCVVFVINAINMIDGLDGLCGGIIAITLMALTCAAFISGGHEMNIPMLVMLGAIFGFLYYNYHHPYRKRAVLFMGDSGSTAIGLTLSWMVIELTQDSGTMGPGLLHPALIAWVLALPVFDALSLFAYRLSHGRSPFGADRCHMHYLICKEGAVNENTVNIIHYLTLAYSGFGVLVIAFFGVPAMYVMPIWLALFGLHYAIIFGAFKETLRKIVDAY